MGSKKDPGKFTVRFNIADPQQRAAAELLNQQGRSKAQFIANAILHYAGGQIPIPNGTLAINSDQIRHLVEDILTQQKAGVADKAIDAALDKPLYNPDRDAIFKTLDAFQAAKTET